MASLGPFPSLDLQVEWRCLISHKGTQNQKYMTRPYPRVAYGSRESSVSLVKLEHSLVFTVGFVEICSFVKSKSLIPGVRKWGGVELVHGSS